MPRTHIRNIAVIAHVDHGKTTLVDAMLKQSGTVQDARNRVMDSKDQEKERGITILAKHTSILPKSAVVGNTTCRINIVDTPGHLDFGGEVERALQMVEGFLLLVDAHEGVKPGTRYVLRKALTLKLKPIIVYNKIDMDSSDLDKAEQQVTDLFLDTAVDADQLDLVSVYGSGRGGYMNLKPEKGGTMQPLFDTILSTIPAPAANAGGSTHLRMLVGNVDELPDGTKIAIGRIFSGTVAVKQMIKVVLEDKQETAMVKKIQLYRGIDKIDVPSASYGDVAIIYLQGPKETHLPLAIGGTLCELEHINPWPYVKPDESTYSLILREIDCKWKGVEIKDPVKNRFVNIRDRLKKEAMNNTALKVEELPGASVKLLGRGLLHLGVILEDLRREDFEFELQAPDTITKVIDGVLHEPHEKITLEFKLDHLQSVTQLLTARHAEIGETEHLPNNRIVQHCEMPARTMGDLNIRFLRATGGDGVIQHEFGGFKPYLKNVQTTRSTGALVSVDTGPTTDYSLAQSKDHGIYFVDVGEQVYYGQVVGEAVKMKPGQDMPINITKAKELTNFRANAAEAALRTKAGYRKEIKTMEDALSWIMPDELVTVTPKSVRIRKMNFDGKSGRAKV